MDSGIKIIIAEDKVAMRNIFRDGLSAHNINTIAEAANGKQLLTILQKAYPDIVLLDLSMPEMDGNETMNHLRRDYPQIKVLILSGFSEYMLMEDYSLRGARGYVVKDEVMDDMQQLAGIIKKIHRGGRHFNFPENPKLTERQKDILQLYANGHTKKSVSDTLGVTESYLRKQEKNLIEKTGHKNIFELLLYLGKSGLAHLRKPKKR